jgi:hypothetical protein
MKGERDRWLQRGRKGRLDGLRMGKRDKQME